MELRPFVPSDLPGIYRVCLLTGDSGRDATPLYENPELLPQIYAGPYPIADPGLTFVAVDEHGLAGYTVATADSAGFDRWLERNWWPSLRRQYPLDGSYGTSPADEDRLRVDHIHHPALAVEALLESYPAHLHIDLLPRIQGGGVGRRLILLLLDALRERGVRGLHLGVGRGNPGAHAFYLKMGFTDLIPEDWGTWMVMDLMV